MDKNKIIQNAQKYVQKGQIDKAIREYSKIAEADPKDIRTRLKIGDLFAKKGSHTQAAATYMQVAEAYGQQGFFLKAVAVYKQILKLQPDLVDVNLKLADLYHQLGLMSDAMAQFQTVVEHYETAGNVSYVFETLRKMLDIDPDNVATRIKLAELYSKEKMVAEAIEEFRQAAAWLKERNRIDDYVKVLERLAYHQSDDLNLTRDLANIYLAKGDTKRSLAKLQVCFKANPRDVETLNLLAQAFLELGQTAKTVAVYKEMGKIHGDSGRVEDQRVAWKKVLELSPDDSEARTALGGRPEAAKAAPRPAPATAGPPPGARPPGGAPPGTRPAAGAPPGVRAPVAAPAGARPVPASSSARPAQVAPSGSSPPRGAPPGAAAAKAAAPQVSSAATVAKLLTETEVYVKYGLHEKAIEHIKKVFAIEPNHIEAHEKAKGLFETAGNLEAAGHELVTLIKITMDSNPEGARGYLKELSTVAPHLPEYKGFVDKLGAPEPEHVSFLDQRGPTIDADDEDEVIIAGDDDEVLVADYTDDFDSDLDADDEALDVGDMEDEALDVSDEDEDDPSSKEGVFIIDDDLLAAGDLDQAMEEAERSVAEEEVEASSEDDDIALDAAPDLEEQDSAQMLGDVSASEQGGDEVSIEDDEVSLADAGDDLVDDDLLSDIDTGAGLDADADLDAAEPELESRDDFGIDTDMVAAGVPDLEDLPEHEDRAVTQEIPALDDPISDAQEPSVAAVEPMASQADVPEESEVLTSSSEVPEEIADELEEAQFFLEQGLPDEAREVVQSILEIHPDSPHALELLARIDADGGEDLEVSEVSDEDLVADEAPPESASADVASVEADAHGAGEDLGKTGDFEDFDLADELADELGDLDSVDDGDAPLEDFQVSADDVFAEFKKGVAKTVGSEDAETHYDLGIAYREMGLTSDAIGEFELAAAKPNKRLDAMTMVGLCHRELGNLDAAEEAYLSCIETPHIDPAVAKSIHYDLGTVYLDKGEEPRAKLHFKKTVEIDSGFRDAKERLEALADVREETEQSPSSSSLQNGVPDEDGSSSETDDQIPRSTKSSKVGYV